VPSIWSRLHGSIEYSAPCRIVSRIQGPLWYHFYVICFSCYGCIVLVVSASYVFVMIMKDCHQRNSSFDYTINVLAVNNFCEYGTYVLHSWKLSLRENNSYFRWRHHSSSGLKSWLVCCNLFLLKSRSNCKTSSCKSSTRNNNKTFC